MSTSIDLEAKRPNRLHLATGSAVLFLGYIGLLLFIAWLKH